MLRLCSRWTLYLLNACVPVSSALGASGILVPFIVVFNVLDHPPPPPPPRTEESLSRSGRRADISEDVRGASGGGGSSPVYVGRVRTSTACYGKFIGPEMSLCHSEDPEAGASAAWVKRSRTGDVCGFISLMVLRFELRRTRLFSRPPPPADRSRNGRFFDNISPSFPLSAPAFLLSPSRTFKNQTQPAARLFFSSSIPDSQIGFKSSHRGLSEQQKRGRRCSSSGNLFGLNRTAGDVITSCG